jgi:hypothetical protein
MSLFARAPLATGCTIEIAHTSDSLAAHVTLDSDVALGPGDKVTVHGAPVRVRFGETMVIRRAATVRFANAFERAWTKWRARFDLAELYEVSFSPERLAALPARAPTLPTQERAHA